MATIRELDPSEGHDDINAELSVVRGGITVKPHVQRFFDDLEDELGFALDLGTYNGHSPPEGPTQAVDFFNAVSTAGYNVQDRACDFFIRNAKRYGGRYCIRRSQIWNVERASEGFRWQTVYGDVILDHKNHSHFTFYADAPINHEQPDEPEPTGKDVGMLSVRYIWDGLDWVFDGPSRVFAAIGVNGVLKACDKVGMKELGPVDKGTHEWFRDVASMWGGVQADG